MRQNSRQELPAQAREQCGLPEEQVEANCLIGKALLFNIFI
jgi:hypothetical protein